MADVLIVCVREDEPRAKALAEMFEAAGFSIGGAPSSDGALRSSGAGLVVWSQASIRSRPFLDAAQRVINAEKAVVASLIEPPPPSSIGDSPVFDLSNWDGDPNDPSLDPLFFAVDRMVNAARASVGASAQDERYEPPAPTYEAPPPRSSRPPPPAPQANFARSAAPGDALGTEAEHWRAIRDSRNPTDFMDYLARYGPEGAFAEIAELKLKQLTQTSETRTPSRPLTPPSARSAPAPTSRPTLPPRAEAPRRLDPPPMRRSEPPPPVRRSLPPDRDFDRNDLRDPPPKAEGGPLRAFVLIALLGGAALAGGLYFGGGIPDFASSPPAEEQYADSASPSAPSEEPGDALDEPVGVPLEDTAVPASAAERRAERRETTEAAPARREPAPAPARPREPTPASSTPAPTTSWAGTTSGGPTSLSPNSQQVASNNTGAVPLSPSTTGSNLPTSMPATAARAAPRGTVVWAQRPSARRMQELYPSRANQQGAGGRVQLDCTVRADLALACAVASESPAGMGFGRAALGAAAAYRAQPSLSDGTEAIGARTRIVVNFQAPSER